MYHYHYFCHLVTWLCITSYVEKYVATLTRIYCQPIPCVIILRQYRVRWPCELHSCKVLMIHTFWDELQQYHHGCRDTSLLCRSGCWSTSRIGCNIETHTQCWVGRGVYVQCVPLPSYWRDKSTTIQQLSWHTFVSFQYWNMSNAIIFGGIVQNEQHGTKWATCQQHVGNIPC